MKQQNIVLHAVFNMSHLEYVVWKIFINLLNCILKGCKDVNL